MSAPVFVLGDDIGFVRLEDFSGGDHAVTRSARVSYRSTAAEPERDRRLIAYLLTHQHGTPFESSSFVFHVKAPLFVARQWFRHRIASYNEVSGRYSEMKDEFYIPEVYRAQDVKNRQGSVAAELNHLAIRMTVRAACDDAFARYKYLLDAGVAKEMARMVLPVNLYTEFYFTANARSLLHFVGLRSEAHAQAEIRVYSDAMFRVLAEKMPWTAEAYLATLNTRHESYPGLFPQGAITDA